MTEQKQRYKNSCPHDVHRGKGVGHKARWRSTRVRMKCHQLYNLRVLNRLLPHSRAASFPATPPSLRASFEGLPYVSANKRKGAAPKTSCSNHFLCTLLALSILAVGETEGERGKALPQPGASWVVVCIESPLAWQTCFSLMGLVCS